MEKYDIIGKSYNKTRKADPYLLSRMRDLLQVKSGCHYLDVGCGTGNYTVKLHSTNSPFIGVDPSGTMLQCARQQSPEVEWINGRAEEIPLPDKKVEGVLASLTTHHWSDLEQGFKEIRRVLKPNGRLVIFTSTTEQMEYYWLKHYFPKAIQRSAEQMPSYTATVQALKAAGFTSISSETYRVRPDLQDHFLLSGTHNPELYFDPVFRAGISTFSSLAEPDEVSDGLEKLRTDMVNGTFREVVQSFDSDRGDYLFIIAE